MRTASAKKWFLSRKVCRSFVCMEKHTETMNYSIRSTTLTRRAVANIRPSGPKQPADFAEGSWKLRGRLAPCLQASAYTSTSSPSGGQAYTLCANTGETWLSRLTSGDFAFCANTPESKFCKETCATEGLRK